MDVALPKSAALGKNVETHAAVVGAGIAGLSAAYKLSAQGRSAAVFADQPG